MIFRTLVYYGVLYMVQCDIQDISILYGVLYIVQCDIQDISILWCTVYGTM